MLGNLFAVTAKECGVRSGGVGIYIIHNTGPQSEHKPSLLAPAIQLSWMQFACLACYDEAGVGLQS